MARPRSGGQPGRYVQMAKRRRIRRNRRRHPSQSRRGLQLQRIAAGRADQALHRHHRSGQVRRAGRDDHLHAQSTPMPAAIPPALAPITLTITDTLEVPGTIYSSAFGDVHILTYNGLQYDFQAVGEFTLAKSNIADDSFDIQLRLQPYNDLRFRHLYPAGRRVARRRSRHLRHPELQPPRRRARRRQRDDAQHGRPHADARWRDHHRSFAEPVEGRLEHRRDDDGDGGDTFAARCHLF